MKFVFHRASMVAFFVAVLGLLLAAPGQLMAGEYTVRQCEGALFQGFFGDYRQLGPVDRVDVVRGCEPGQATKVGIYQNRGGSQIPFGSGGQFIWDAPDGIEIFGTVFTSRLNDVNGIQAQLLGPSGPFGDVSLDEGTPHDGASRTTRWTNSGQPRSLILARLSCRWGGGCPNAVGGQKAFFEVTDAEFRSRDVVSPTVAGSGYLWFWSNDWQWHRGDMNFRIDATDVGAGVASTYLFVNGLKVILGSVHCPGDRVTFANRFDPCPASAVSTGIARTATPPFQEGINVVRFCTADYAGSANDANQTCSVNRVIYIDNVAPAAPIDLRSVGGSDWRAINGFEVVWGNPEGQKSPIDSADFRVVRASDNQTVEAGSVGLAGGLRLPTIQLPAPGEYRVEVTLRDLAGNLGAPGSTTLRFDDRRPGDVSPEAPTGWISADELPYRQPIERAEPGGPSGVGGYALAVSRSGTLAPCPTGSCGPQELSLNSGVDERVATLQSLPEGDNWISAVAASGARLASASVGSRVVQVDKTDPVTILYGNPGAWVNHPVTLTAVATDSGSGMAASSGDDGEPATTIRAGNSAPYESPGDRATFTVADEGETRIEYWAEDLAGNTNDGETLGSGEAHATPSVSTVRIDRRAPQVDFGRPDPTDPELIQAKVRDSDSGFDSGSLWFRAAGDRSEFTELDTTTREGRMSARLPSDTLPRGNYLIRAVTVDRAGNVGDTAVDGSGMTVSVPVKRETHLRAAFQRKRSSRRSKARFDRRVGIKGRLSHGEGKVLAGVPLLVTQKFAVGSRRPKATLRTRTDGTGRFFLRLRPGPSRTIRVTYRGNRVNQRVVSRRLLLTMRDRVSFGISPGVLRNRGRVRMSGLVRGKGALRPSRGKLVAIQYFDPSRSKWRPVEVLRANRKGRFRYRYRFRTIDYTQRIIFRAVSLPESGWPFQPSTSRPRSVIVYPAR